MRRILGALVLSVVLLASPPAGAYPREIEIAYLQRLDWESDYPQAMECFASHPAIPAGWTITHEAVDMARLVTGEQDITGVELAIITGHVYYSLLPEERTILESFVDAGGILWFDDCGSVEVDNLPFAYEINFGGTELGAWGTCYGDLFTVVVPDHPLMNNVYGITASMMRNDPGLIGAQWFTPFYAQDAAYTTVVIGQSIGTYTFSGPAIIAARHGLGAIVATAMDVSCALECVAYGNPGRPLSDYYLVINMLGWYDGDLDGISDHDEGALLPVETDTDGDTTIDAFDPDSDGDRILDQVEAGDTNPDTPPVDTDADTVPDFRDTDSDGDTILDHTEQYADSDGDHLPDPDADGDTIPNRLDLDSDNDGVPDESEGESDLDGDGILGFVDANDRDGPTGDLDGDGVWNADDNCPEVANPEQRDCDGDGIGDECDPDVCPPDGGDAGEDGAEEGGADADGADADGDTAEALLPDGSAEGSSCDPTRCVLECRGDGYETGSCVGDECRCTGGGPDGTGDGDGGGPPGVGDGGAGGCGCSAADVGTSGFALMLGTLGMIRLVVRRRRDGRRGR